MTAEKDKKTCGLSRGERLKRDYKYFFYVLPVLVGVALFTLLPMIVSLVYSFSDYDFTKAENQITQFTLRNYRRMFTDKALGYSLFITFRYSIVTVVLSMAGSYALALFLNQKLKVIPALRVIYYLPNLIPAIAGTLLWKNILDTDTGYLNLIFSGLGLPKYTFYDLKETVFPTILFTSLFGWGGGTIMWLAQMKNIPAEMYEAADLDGANYFHKLWYITIPMTTSMIFYILITSIISSLQVFGGFYALRNGINDSEINFIVLKIYIDGFEGFDLSYACALSWLLFVIIGVLTTFIFKTSKWVYYGEEA